MNFAVDVKRVLILGIDSVEYDLVERWNLTNLMQEEYGRTRLWLGREPPVFMHYFLYAL